jgi:16S rRNA (cytosine1402-N4)-methyltransferase
VLSSHTSDTGELAHVVPEVGHRSVLLREALDVLEPRPGEIVVDATLGAGGHAERLAEAVGPRGRVIGIDRDPIAIERARHRLARFQDAFTAVRGDHRELPLLLEALGVRVVDRVLFDLGVSSLQLDDPARGFSFSSDGPLDMRMDPGAGATAADLVASLSEEELRTLLWRLGEERGARAIARAVVRERSRRPIRRTTQLVEIVERALGPAARRHRIHPATRTFLALRLAVNRELDDLGATLAAAVDRLRPGGRIAVISFHSLEDRIAKRTLAGLAHRCICPPRLPRCGCGRRDLVRLLGRRSIRPTAAEVRDNPRSRSARLRGAEKL